jgi:T-complex protein 1 subunit alpha
VYDFAGGFLSTHPFFFAVAQVVVTDTKQVEEIRQREMDITKEKIQRILATGARVILTTKGIDDLCLKYFVEVRRRATTLWVAGHAACCLLSSPCTCVCVLLSSYVPCPMPRASVPPQAGAIAVRRVKPEDIKRIAKATGGQVVVTMADMEGDEAFDANALGEVRPS